MMAKFFLLEFSKQFLKLWNKKNIPTQPLLKKKVDIFQLKKKYAKSHIIANLKSKTTYSFK
jgi:hypothetical protein